LVSSLVAGEKVTMKINVNVLKDAEVVQVEIPMRAECNDVSGKSENWRMHLGYRKDKVI